MYELLRRQMTDLVLKASLQCLESILTSCNHYQANVRYMLVKSKGSFEGNTERTKLSQKSP